MLTSYQTTVINDIVKSGQAFALRAYIDQVADSISDTWTVHDVIDYCSSNDIPITFTQAAKVLDYMRDNYDSDIGYNTDVLAAAVQEVV